MIFSQIAPIKQAEIIEIFEGLRPTECLSLDLTEAQIERWREIKRNWTVLKTALENYFSGQYIFQDLPNLPIEKRDTELFELVLQRYLSLYDLLNWGWPDIEDFHAGIEIPANNPGQAFAYILKGKATCEFLDECKFSTRTLYDACKYFRYCEKQGNQLTQKHKTKLDTFTRRLQKKNPLSYPDYLFFLECCIEACRTSKNATVKKKCKKFEAINLDWRETLLSYLHPRKSGKANSYKT